MARASMCGQTMRPNEIACAAPSRKPRIEPVGPADREGELARARVGGAAQQVGELRGIELAPALVERDQMGALRHGRGEQRGLGGGASAAAVLDLDDPRRAEAERPPGAVEAGEVVGDELRLRAGPQAAHGEDRHPQGPQTVLAARGRAGCGSHIFSSW